MNNGNKLPSLPLAHNAHLNDVMNPVLENMKPEQHKWLISQLTKVIEAKFKEGGFASPNIEKLIKDSSLTYCYHIEKHRRTLYWRHKKIPSNNKFADFSKK